MSYTTINKSSDHFDTKIYTGNGSSQTLDMDNLGLLWMKNRTETSNHNLFDVVRGGYYTSDPGPNLRPNGTTPGSGSDITSAYGITFGSSSSTIGSDGGGYNYNQNSKSYVGWQWRANGTGSANTDGSITSTVSANTTAGFSIVKYTGTGANATVGHGLSSAPKMIMVKCLSQTDAWGVYHSDVGAGKYLKLNEASAESTATTVFPTAQTSSFFYLGDSGLVNGSGRTYIAYCFQDVVGYSKCGSYVGNGDVDGTFIFTGHKPKFVLIKRKDGGDHWNIPVFTTDTNGTVNTISPNLNSAERTMNNNPAIDYYSNGFKLKTVDANYNISDGNYIYIAIGQSIVGSNNIPATAR